MAKGSVTDYFGKAGTELKLGPNSDNPSIQTAEAIDERGDNIARETFESLTAPSNDYTICADWTASAAIGSGAWLGEWIDNTLEPGYVVTGFVINTAAATAPTVVFSGESVPTGGAQGASYTPTTQIVLADHVAQILFEAFTLVGVGCHTVSCSATGSCTLTRGLNEDGETCSWDVSNGKIEVTASFSKSADIDPTVTPGTGWIATTPLKHDESNTDYEKYDITLTYTPVTAAAPV